MSRLLLAVVPFALLSACRESGRAGPPTSGVISPSGPEKTKLISRGKAFSEKDYRVAGYVTILDFYADW